jgi:formylglycine-generating enzyme required for sulfatase activity
MSGNVYEWCLDWFDKYKIKIKNNPSGPAEGETKVLRGGCWYYNAMLSQIARRSYLSPDDKGFDIGLRLLLPVG